MHGESIYQKIVVVVGTIIIIIH